MSVLTVTLNSTPTATAAWNAVPQPASISVDDQMIQECLAGAPPLPRNKDLSITGNGGSLDVPSGIRYLYGRTSSKVASVEIITTDRLEVTSSVSDGAFMAWWPGSEAPDQAIARDAVGKVIATMHPETK